MVLLALSTAGAVGMLTYWNLEKAILPSELARLQAHGQRQAARLEEVISLARDDVIAFASGAAALEGIVRARLNGGRDPQDGTTEQVWRTRMARRFAADLQAKPGYTQFRIIGVADGGREIVRVDRSGPDGVVRIVPDDQLQAKGDRAYFTEALKLPASAVYFSNIELNQEHGKIEVPHVPVIRAATPIHTPAGEPFGIVIINVDLREAFARLSTPEHPTGNVYVVNQDGAYLLHPQAERSFGFEFGRQDRVQDEYPELAADLGKAEARVSVMRSAAGESLGVAMLPLHLAGGRWLALIETVPEAELLSSLVLVRHSGLVAGGVVALLAMGLALALARSLTRPLMVLTQRVESFSVGQPAPLKIHATGEIDVLARAFEKLQWEMNAKTEALRRSERHFRALLEHSADGIVLIDAANKILYVSPSVLMVEGYAPEELLGRNGLENTHPEDLPIVQAAVQKLVANPGRPVPVLWRRRHKEGRWLWLEGVATNLLHDPAIGAIVTNYRDVTPRIKAEAALRQSQEEFKTLFDQAPFGYHEVDAEGRVCRVNQAELDMLGYQAEELLGRPVWEISADPALSRQAVHDKLNGQIPPQSFERLLRKKDGSSFPALIQDRLVRREDGTIMGIRANVQDITDRKRAEEALRASEGRYRTLFEYAPDGILIADPQSYYLDVNPSMCRMLGYTREEFIGLHASAIVAEVELPYIGQALNVLTAKADYRREWLFRRKDGSSFAAEVIAAKMPDGNLLAMIHDVSERKRSEQAIRESEEYFRFLNDLAEATRALADPVQIMATVARMLGEHLHVSRCAYADVDEGGERFTIVHDYTDGCESTVGDYQLSLFGTNASDTLRRGETLIIRDVEAELSPTSGADMFTAIGIKAIITCPLVKEGSLRAMMAVHQTTPRNWTPREIRIVEDVVERCWATIERRTAEAQISQLNVELEHRVIERTAELDDLYNNAPCGYHSLDEKGLFIGINDTELVWLGYTREEVVGRMNATDMLTPASAEVFQKSYAAFKASGRLENLELELVRKDGSILPVLLTATIAADEHGHFLRSRSTIIDYTDRKRADVALREAQVRLESANKELEAFSYSVSHDLRAPLRGIDGFTRILRDEYAATLDDEGRRMLEIICSESRRMGQLIDDLLKFSRMSRQELMVTPVDMTGMARSVFAEVAKTHAGTVPKLVLKPLPEVNGDRATLRQVLVNLLSNAAKFTTREADPVIEMGATSAEGVATFYVKDNGVGFDQKYSGKLFGVFQRLHSESEFEGTGVGLALVQRIIHRHGGKIWAEGRLGVGATFYFTLPINPQNIS
jgi:PAS domain S-box-containing protein